MRLEALSNLDCKTDEIAALLASLQKPEEVDGDGPTPIDKMMMRYKKQEKGCYGEAITEHLHKLKGQQDKYNSMGDRKKMAEMIEKKQALLDLSQADPVDYEKIRKLVPGLKVVPGKFAIKDEFIWEQILDGMKTTDKLVPSHEERSPRAVEGKRKRDSGDDDRSGGKRGRDDRDRDRGRDRDRDRDRDRERDRPRDDRGGRDDKRASVWDKRDDRPLKQAKSFVVDSGRRGAAPAQMADQGYSRGRPSVNTDAGYSRQAWGGGGDAQRSPNMDRGRSGFSPQGGGGPPAGNTDQGYNRDGPPSSGGQSVEALMRQAQDGGMSPRALLQNADKLAKELEMQLQQGGGGGGGWGGGDRGGDCGGDRGPPPGGGGGGGGGFGGPAPGDDQRPGDQWRGIFWPTSLDR